MAKISMLTPWNFILKVLLDTAKNPITLWFKFLLTKFYYEFVYSNIHLKIGYMTRFTNCQFGNYNTLYIDVTLNNVVMGDFSYVANNTKISNANIGKFSSIGPEVLIGLGKHPSRDLVSTHPIFYSQFNQAQISFATNSGFNEYERIEIGNDVWIGARAVILDGVIIGDGAIIGAGAVVTKDVPAYSIVGGVPAKLIRYRFDLNEIVFLKNLKWWEKDIAWLRKNYKQFNDIKKLMIFCNDATK